MPPLVSSISAGIFSGRIGNIIFKALGKTKMGVVGAVSLPCLETTENFEAVTADQSFREPVRLPGLPGHKVCHALRD